MSGLQNIFLGQIKISVALHLQTIFVSIIHYKKHRRLNIRIVLMRLIYPVFSMARLTDELKSEDMLSMVKIKLYHIYLYSTYWCTVLFFTIYFSVLFDEIYISLKM